VLVPAHRSQLAEDLDLSQNGAALLVAQEDVLHNFDGHFHLGVLMASFVDCAEAALANNRAQLVVGHGFLERREHLNTGQVLFLGGI